MLALDGVRIGATDPPAAGAAYAALLGVSTTARVGVLRFVLDRGAVEITPAAASGLQSLQLVGTPCAGSPIDWHGLDVQVSIVPPDARPTGARPLAIDHVVVHTPDAERAIALWRDRVGLRLALDRAFPARGLRLLFFRSAGMTLELACPLGDGVDRHGPDRLWGIAYAVADLEVERARLLAAGLDVSEARAGNKPGTRVATVRSGTLGVPTLLVAAVSGPGAPSHPA